jgi:hypothetical protein
VNDCCALYQLNSSFAMLCSGAIYTATYTDINTTSLVCMFRTPFVSIYKHTLVQAAGGWKTVELGASTVPPFQQAKRAAPIKAVARSSSSFGSSSSHCSSSRDLGFHKSTAQAALTSTAATALTAAPGTITAGFGSDDWYERAAAAMPAASLKAYSEKHGAYSTQPAVKPAAAVAAAVAVAIAAEGSKDAKKAAITAVTPPVHSATSKKIESVAAPLAAEQASKGSTVITVAEAVVSTVDAQSWPSPRRATSMRAPGSKVTIILVTAHFSLYTLMHTVVSAVAVHGVLHSSLVLCFTAYALHERTVLYSA